MRVVDDFRAIAPRLERPAIAIGNFDGVHRGHAALFATARAAAAGGQVCALTFEPHPVQVLAPHAAPARITTSTRKLELLAAAGVDVAVVVPFTAAFAHHSADEFTADILAGALGARHVVVGGDFTYGRGRAGTTATLRAAGEGLGFATHVVAAVTDGERAVRPSSPTAPWSSRSTSSTSTPICTTSRCASSSSPACATRPATTPWPRSWRRSTPTSAPRARSWRRRRRASAREIAAPAAAFCYVSGNPRSTP
jgi:FAD synthase